MGNKEKKKTKNETDKNQQKDEAMNQEKTLRGIINNFGDMESSIIAQLKMGVSAHPGTTGSNREVNWGKLFKRLVPKKFCIAQGVFAIDSKKHVSKEIDLAIYDETYTPYLFRYKKIKFIPIEAIAVVVQCKSTNPGKAELREWVGSIDKLETSCDSLVRLAQRLVDNSLALSRNHKELGLAKLTQTATRPLRVLCSLAKQSQVEEFLATGDEKDSEKFDLILGFNVSGDQDYLYKKFRDFTEKNNNNMGEIIRWYEILNHHDKTIWDLKANPYGATNRGIDIKQGQNSTGKDGPRSIYKSAMDERTMQQLQVGQGEKENVILSLTFQLNQLLMLINNPMPFPHRAYAQMFNSLIQNTSAAEGAPQEEEKEPKDV